MFTIVFCGLVAAQIAVNASGLFTVGLGGRRTYECINYLLFASLFAVALRHARIKYFFVRYMPPYVAVSGAILATILGTLSSPGSLPQRLSHLENAERIIWYSCTFVVVSTCLHPRSLTTRILEIPPLKFIGRISYSLYLWHVIFFISRSPVVGIRWRPLLTISERPSRYIVTLTVALASYYFVEKPFIRMGHRLATPSSPGHDDLKETVPLLG